MSKLTLGPVMVFIVLFVAPVRLSTALLLISAFAFLRLGMILHESSRKVDQVCADINGEMAGAVTNVYETLATQGITNVCATRGQNNAQ